MHLGQIILRDGIRAEVLRILAPEAQWSSQIAGLLGHKPASFRWGNELMLREPLGIEIYFYLVMVDDVAIANIKTMEFQGVGMLGDVYTRPEYRGRGVASQLMQSLMNDFKMRGGLALYLGTGYNTPPYHIYAKYGFNGIEEKSGTMAYFTESSFTKKYFAAAPVTIRALDWQHYPTSAALFAAAVSGVVRCWPLQLIGRCNSEGALLVLMERIQKNALSCGAFGLQKANGALVGFAMWDCDSNWPDVALVDIFCHPHFWEYGSKLLSSMLQSIPDSNRGLIAYSDIQCPQKSEILHQAGFSHKATLKRWVKAAETRIDVEQFILSKF